MHLENIGVTISKLRKARGMARAELSERAGISESHLNKIEVGNRKLGWRQIRKL